MCVVAGLERGYFVWVAALAVVCAVVASAANGATSPWAKKANAVCATWAKKAAVTFGANGTQPTTPKQMYTFMVKQRPLEQGLLVDLKKISLPRPPGAAKALSLAAADIRELSTVIQRYGDESNALFKHDFFVWNADSRANSAFAAIGARGCS